MLIQTAQMNYDGTYLAHNPTWDIEDSPLKASWVAYMISRNNPALKTICEVGCGAGEILRGSRYSGYCR